MKIKIDLHKQQIKLKQKLEVDMEPIIRKAKNEFQKILNEITNGLDNQDLNEVESTVFKSLMSLGKCLLECHIEKRSKNQESIKAKKLLKTRSYYLAFAHFKTS